MGEVIFFLSKCKNKTFWKMYLIYKKTRQKMCFENVMICCLINITLQRICIYEISQTYFIIYFYKIIIVFELF